MACPAPGGGKPVDEFRDKLEEEAYQNFYAVLDGLAKIERNFWRRPQFDVLHGYPNMGEILFSGDKKTYRVFGYFGPRRKHFTMLAGHEKKRALDEKMKLADKRRKFAERNEDLLYEFTFEEESS